MLIASHARTSSITVALIALVACSRVGNDVSKPRACDDTPLKVFRAVLEDNEFRKFGRAYFERTAKPVLIWENMPALLQSCITDDFGFMVGNSASTDFRREETVLLVTKVYYDHDAAFVEMDFWQPNNWRGFLRSGKTGDFFLRNENGWKVEQRVLGER